MATTKTLKSAIAHARDIRVETATARKKIADYATNDFQEKFEALVTALEPQNLAARQAAFDQQDEDDLAAALRDYEWITDPRYKERPREYSDRDRAQYLADVKVHMDKKERKTSAEDYLKTQHREAMLQRMPYFERNATHAIEEMRQDIRHLEFKNMIASWLLVGTVIVICLLRLAPAI